MVWYEMRRDETGRGRGLRVLGFWLVDWLAWWCGLDWTGRGRKCLDWTWIRRDEAGWVAGAETEGHWSDTFQWGS